MTPTAMNDLSTEKSLASIGINNRLFFRFFQAANTLHTKGTQALDKFGVTTQPWSVLGALSRPKVEGGMIGRRGFRWSKTPEQRFKNSIPKMYALNAEASILPRRMSAALKR